MSAGRSFRRAYRLLLTAIPTFALLPCYRGSVITVTEKRLTKAECFRCRRGVFSRNRQEFRIIFGRKRGMLSFKRPPSVLRERRLSPKENLDYKRIVAPHQKNTCVDTFGVSQKCVFCTKRCPYDTTLFYPDGSAFGFVHPRNLIGHGVGCHALLCTNGSSKRARCQTTAGHSDLEANAQR